MTLEDELPGLFHELADAHSDNTTTEHMLT
jgi:hypothetical protein